MPSFPKVIGVGTDCSGMEAPIQAMENLGVNFEHRFSCDIDKSARATIEANFPHGKMYDDVTTRDNSSAPPCDLYVAGFPCQPFSSAGLRQGFEDSLGRGKIFFDVRDYIAKQRPRVFVLENVEGLVSRNSGQYFAAILKALAQLGEYNVSHCILNTKDHGVPHNRKRVYIVGIRQDVDKGTFEFPKPIPCPSIELFLDGRPNKKEAVGNLPHTITARGNVIHFRRKLTRQGSDPIAEPHIVDIDSTRNRAKAMYSVTPCITVGRARGHWITNRGRRFRKTEMTRLQGMNPTKLAQVVSEAQLGKQLGNTMSVNVLERILVRLLPAAGLVAPGRLRDRWANGSAVRQLARTRDCGFAQRSRLVLLRKGRRAPGSGKATAAAAKVACGSKRRAAGGAATAAAKRARRSTR